MSVTIVCWHCGNKVVVEAERPQLGLDFIGLAKRAGMNAYLDSGRSRVLAFCNDAHASAETTKTGAFRLRPKGPPPIPIP